jgi:hypothetical protein
MVRIFDQVRDPLSSLMRLCRSATVTRLLWHMVVRMPAHPALEPLLPVVYSLVDGRHGFIEAMSIIGILVISYALVGIRAMRGKGSK